MGVHIIPQLSKPDNSTPTGQCDGYHGNNLNYEIDAARRQALEQFFDREPIHLALSIEAGGELVR